MVVRKLPEIVKFDSQYLHAVIRACCNLQSTFEPLAATATAELALRIAERKHGTDSSEYCQCLKLVADLHAAQGNEKLAASWNGRFYSQQAERQESNKELEAALSSLRKAAEYSECHPGKSSLQHIGHKIRLGRLLTGLSDLREATLHFQDALSLLESLPLNMDQKRSEVLSYLVNVYLQQGNYQEALKASKTCLDISIQFYGFNHLSTAEAAQRIGEVYEQSSEDSATRYCDLADAVRLFAFDCTYCLSFLRCLGSMLLL